MQIESNTAAAAATSINFVDTCCQISHVPCQTAEWSGEEGRSVHTFGQIRVLINLPVNFVVFNFHFTLLRNTPTLTHIHTHTHTRGAAAVVLGIYMEKAR